MAEHPRTSRFEPKVCASCGEAFRSPEPTRKYCSSVCRWKANAARRRGKERGEPSGVDLPVADPAPWEEG